MARPKAYTFKVCGATRFPIDMLRYDQASPTSESDSALITSSVSGFQNGSMLISITSSNPPSGRWASFGWQVV